MPMNASMLEGPVRLSRAELGKVDGAGELDRAALGSLIFSNPEERRKLNKATHLPVYVEMCRQLLLHWLTCKALVVGLVLAQVAALR